MKVYLSLGGNEGQVLSRLQQAIAQLSSHQGMIDLKVSRLYRTAPVQVDSSLWFVNAVCSFQTSLAPSEVFAITQSIETQLGKIPKPKNASRPIDIDVLFYGDQVYQDKDLQIPHPRWKERLFVLLPLADLTEEILIQEPTKMERYILKDLIHPLLTQSSQTAYLLEKNS